MQFPIFSTAASPAALAPGLPALFSPEQFLTFIVWVLLPAVGLVWVNYYHQQQRLRQIHRKMRQLEARLSQALPSATSALPLNEAPGRFAGPPAGLRPSKPSSLTNPVRAGGHPAGPSPFTHPVPLPGC